VKVAAKILKGLHQCFAGRRVCGRDARTTAGTGCRRYSSAPRKASFAVGGGWEVGIECRLFGSSGNPGSERLTPKS